MIDTNSSVGDENSNLRFFEQPLEVSIERDKVFTQLNYCCCQPCVGNIVSSQFLLKA